MKKVLISLGAVVALVLVLPAAPSGAGGEIEGSTTVTKAVEGTGPGGDYGFEIDCDDNVFDFDLAAGESSTGSGDAASCTVTEVDDRGADSVAYSCVATGQAVCSPDGRTVSWPPAGIGSAEITVTNTFVDPTTTTTSTTTTTGAPTTTAAAAAAQAAQPTFTG